MKAIQEDPGKSGGRVLGDKATSLTPWGGRGREGEKAVNYVVHLCPSEAPGPPGYPAFSSTSNLL